MDKFEVREQVGRIQSKLKQCTNLEDAKILLEMVRRLECHGSTKPCGKSEGHDP